MKCYSNIKNNLRITLIAILFIAINTNLAAQNEPITNIGKSFSEVKEMYPQLGL